MLRGLTSDSVAQLIDTIRTLRFFSRSISDWRGISTVHEWYREVVCRAHHDLPDLALRNVTELNLLDGYRLSGRPV